MNRTIWKPLALENSFIKRTAYIVCSHSNPQKNNYLPFCYKDCATPKEHSLHDQYNISVCATSHFFQGHWRSLSVRKQKQIPILNSKNNLAEFGKMRSAEIVKNRVVPCETKNFDRLFETSLTHRQKTGWFWTVFRDIWTLIGKKTNKQTTIRELTICRSP